MEEERKKTLFLDSYLRHLMGEGKEKEKEKNRCEQKKKNNKKKKTGTYSG